MFFLYQRTVQSFLMADPWVQVMELMELTALRNAHVGSPGISGLSVEQRKRLTIGVELVANPSIIFMDVSLVQPSQSCPPHKLSRREALWYCKVHHLAACLGCRETSTNGLLASHAMGRTSIIAS